MQQSAPQKQTTKAPLPAWEEEDEVTPWDEKPTVLPEPEPEAKQFPKGNAQTTPVSSNAQDPKMAFYLEMGKINAGVSQSIRFCQRIVQIKDKVYLVFGIKDNVFVDALRQHQQELDRIAVTLYGEGVTARTCTEDKLPPVPIDERAMSQKAKEIFGVPIEIDNS
jgi:hypothetical protein